MFKKIKNFVKIQKAIVIYKIGNQYCRVLCWYRGRVSLLDWLQVASRTIINFKIDENADLLSDVCNRLGIYNYYKELFDSVYYIIHIDD